MNNMYPNNGYQQVPIGYNYGTPRPTAKNTQPLTQEEINKLRHMEDKLSLVIPEEDLLKCACTHKEKNGANALVQQADGTVICSICKAHFTPFDGTDKEIDDIIKRIIGMLQTAKMIYLDASDELVRQYFQLIPMLERFPKLWTVALGNFNKYDGYETNPVPTYGNFGNGFTAINALLTNPYAAYQANGFAQPMAYPQAQPQPQQQMAYVPVMQNGQQVYVPVQQGGYVAGPQYAPQPQNYAAPQPQQPVDPSNPMAYGVPTQPPMAPAPGAMPQAPADQSQTNEIQQQKSFNV